VIILSVTQLLHLAQSSSPPRDAFLSIVLDQSDLTKVSPFVLSSVTPARIFVGRDAERATLLATLATNSVAVLGGRRIGKTSLMKHVTAALESADFEPFFADCQAVKT